MALLGTRTVGPESRIVVCASVLDARGDNGLMIEKRRPVQRCCHLVDDLALADRCEAFPPCLKRVGGEPGPVRDLAHDLQWVDAPV